MSWLVFVSLCFSGPSAVAAEPSPAPSPSASDPLFHFADPRIVESSGLATSSYGDGIVYTHNDSGDIARFFAVDPRGETVAVYTLRGATNVDWEDMASGTDLDGRPLLYLADIGDNAGSRKEIVVYQVREPRGPSADVPWVRYRFSYSDGAHDAESLLVDPRTSRLYIVTKSLIGDGELFAAPTTLSTTALNVLTPIRPVPPLTTSGDFSPDGTRIVLLTYFRAYQATGVTGTLQAFEVPPQKQDEAITFTRDGNSVLVGSEGAHSAVFRVVVPGVHPPASSSHATTPPTSSSSAAISPARDRVSITWTPLILIGVLTFVGVALGLIRRLRR